MPGRKSKADKRPSKREFRSAPHWVAALLQFHRLCGNAHCRRAHDCCVDGEPCFDRFWPQIGEDVKVWVRTVLTELPGGKRPSDIIAAAWKAVDD